MAAFELKGDDRLPLYQRLADALRQQIVTYQRRPGDRIPSENELSVEYGLATGTVRQALSQLVEEGLLERIHGRGTFVRRPNFDQSLFRFFRFRAPSGEWTVPESRILKRTVEPAPGYIARKLGITEGEDAISMSRLRLIDGQPVISEEIWLSKQRFAGFLDLAEAEIGPLLYPIYDSACQQLVAQAEEDLTAEIATPEVARLLRVDSSTALIVIERLAKSFGGEPLEWRRSRGRADLFHYHTEIR